MNYILASASPRRRELLGVLGFPFDIRVPGADESIPPGQAPAEAARSIALRKAQAVAAQSPDSCVIAADTIVVIDGEILGKPIDGQDAARMLRMLSGREHRVITGVCIELNGRRRVFSQETAVRFYPLSDDEIADYIRSGEPMDKAGAYGIQALGALFVERIDGDYFNVVGLPIARLARELKEFLHD